MTTTSERDGLEFHLSYLRSRITVKSFDPLLNGFRSFGPAGAAIANRYEFDDEPVEFLGLGIRYDPGEWFVRAETAMLESDTIIGDRHGWYLTAGYRIRSFTPYITLARIDSDGNTSDPGLDTRGLPAPLAAQANGLNAALNDALSLAPAQKSIALGLRWDLARNLALKFQVDYLDLDRGSPGVLMNEQPGFRRGGSVTLLSAAIDFVF
ncbi:MAG: hypothetical protein DWQ08_11490 [Proteobacteria bacterium]|nr:MAG: hypothetical protein DWQ08_11490 [Pseudomonadota bacterium]